MVPQRIPLLVIGGPTGSGKTALAISLAKGYGGEVVSADSMQMYRRMDIATAKPSLEERQGVPHHLMDALDPGETFSVAQYTQLARKVIEEIHSRGGLPMLVGGTGQYISAVVDNLRFSPAEEDPALRQELRDIAAVEGNQALHEMLREVDPEAAGRIHPNNLGRVVRALEVYRLTGKTMTQLVEESRREPSPYQSVVICLDFRDRQLLYRRIDQRVDRMLEEGLVAEAEALFEAGLSATATQAIGYKELRGYLAGEEPLEVAAARIKQETRRYAKRQLTWFRKVTGVQWLYVDDYSGPQGLCFAAEELLNSAGLAAER